MSNKHTRCGIYVITTPNGSQYVGSSNKIERRWHEHRSTLRHGKHRSARLQAAWEKHGDALTFAVLEECAVEALNDREQHWIDVLKPELNTTPHITNVWVNPETRAKLRAVHTSPEWREARRQIAANAVSRFVAVDCSDGRSFVKMADAARAFGVCTSQIRALATTQRPGQRLGVRFKFACDEWRDVLPANVQRGISIRQACARRNAMREAVPA
jgi:predicted GIY-YIG superfamily endonuclease